MRPIARAWPLRHRLLAALLGLSAAALAVFATAGVILLDRSLLSRVDTQLTAFAATLGRGRPPPPLVRPPRRGEVELPSQYRVDFYLPSGASVRAGPRPDDGPDVPAATIAALPPRPFTVPGRSGGTDWRALVVALPDGNRAVVSMSLEAARSTVRELLVIEVAAGALVLVLLGAVALAVVRLGLRPLTRMERTATAIAGGELDRRVADSDPRTETGRLGHALNIMLGRLGEALRQRERSEQRLRHFLADASHELRTPLTSIRGFAELYRHGDREPDPAVARILSRIEGEAERMGVLVEDLLLLARLDQERALDLTEVDLHVVVGDVVHGARARAPGRPIELVLDERPVRVTGDEHRLHQVVANLVGNAVAHTPAGTAVRVTVGETGSGTTNAAPWAGSGTMGAGTEAGAGAEARSGTSDAGAWAGARVSGAAAVIEVRDAGPGIAAEHLPHVFDRFYRADAARSRDSGGTGLGLAIAAALVEAHGGRIEARSGDGTTFRVILPVQGPEGV
ncbi:HAMP domain-containing protein [Nonomuraea sp. KC401]|uniref:sensor histidine kinase n=1 Tax=unclassified Nonomuraea TaxID=2593643 RepID=UPI0010FE5568|nr:HAMP domain-containing sensor histidine kinase [Nonomuraea sp. KC401]NBE97918.1 HAMP domain-containing protein [Nonomuraea sp. K271]TLF61993.1 HAMP domain-containing protein [Nonomuraea sp. KC401]